MSVLPLLRERAVVAEACVRFEETAAARPGYRWWPRRGRSSSAHHGAPEGPEALPEVLEMSRTLPREPQERSA